MVTPSRRAMLEYFPLYYPFGNTRSRNVFESSVCHIGDGGDNMNVTKVLFLGCGDVRNALQATSLAHHNFKSLHIHLNDISPSIIARNIVLLKVISASDFNPNDEEDISFLWEFWYNLEWPDETRKRVQKVLKELLDGSLPENIIISKSSQLQHLREVWKDWYSIIVPLNNETELFPKKIKMERSSFIVRSWNLLMKRYDCLDENITDSSFLRVIEEITSQFENKLGITDQCDEFTKQKIRNEVLLYFRNGSCRLQEHKVAPVCVNPTLLVPTSHHWKVHYTLCPYDGYVPLTKEQLDTAVKDKILLRSCQKILKGLLTSYRERMDIVKIFFHLDDALEFCYAEKNNLFDVIDCSNLADHIGLANVINAASGILSDTPGAMLFTDSMTWRSLAPSVLEYLEEALCTPLSMIPTVYGLRLLSHVELGSSVPTSVHVKLGRMMVPSVDLCWQKAPSLRNITLQSSPALSGFLEQLALKCFIVQDQRKKKKGSSCGMPFYTPLTFDYIVSSMKKRFGYSHWLNEISDQLNIPSPFHLQRRTTEAWKSGIKVVKLSTEIQFDIDFGNPSSVPIDRMGKGGFVIQNCVFVGTPVLRLILIPHTILLKEGPQFVLENLKNGFEDPDVHYIDNLQLKVINSSKGGIKSASISFLMVPDHGLKETHFGYAIDIHTGVPVFHFPSVALFFVEECRQECRLPYPIQLRQPTSLQITPSKMMAGSCIESVSQYILKISIACDESLSGLEVVCTDQQKPCESGHEVTLSLKKPNNIKPLSLSFPHPFLVDSINATLHRKDRFIALILTKALWEPWPCEFRPIKNMVMERFKPWEEKKTNPLMDHICTQFNMSLLKNPTMSSPLIEVRYAIKSLFVNALDRAQEYLEILNQNSKASDWFVRVHLPIRTSPTGCPLLMLSTVDHRMAEKLTSTGQLSVQQATNDFIRIIANHPDIEIVKILVRSEEGAQLLRYILRLNSTKIVPSVWQKKHLPLGENSPWLATFISPLYVDCVNDVEDVNLGILPNVARTANVEGSSCAACSKSTQNLKRCSRCRAVVYCSVDCQRAHWTQHKITCSKT